MLLPWHLFMQYVVVSMVRLGLYFVSTYVYPKIIDGEFNKYGATPGILHFALYKYTSICTVIIVMQVTHLPLCKSIFM